jgi:adenylate cyclase class 2
MAVEIELKAWADSPERIKAALSSFAEYGGEFLKDDEYWFSLSPPAAGTAIPLSGIRIRQEQDTPPKGTTRQITWVTYKAKEVREGIEINQEREFEVSDKAAFEELLVRLGLERGIAKKKTGWTWKYEGITAELCQVDRLGWFAELEIIAGDDKEATVAAARRRLLELLGRIGIGEDKIETRYYTEMLLGLPDDADPEKTGV